jgi:hypothetical protein
MQRRMKLLPLKNFPQETKQVFIINFFILKNLICNLELISVILMDSILLLGH